MRVVPALVALLVVYLSVRAFWWIGSTPGPLLDPLWISEGLLKIALWVVPCLLITRLALRTSHLSAWRALGLAGAPARGYLFGLLASLPMAAVVLYDGRFSTSVDSIAGTVVLGPFAEEVLFRGFLFLALRRAGWRLAPAMVVSALAFAIAHSQRAASAIAMGAGYALFSSVPEWVQPDFWGALSSLIPFLAIGIVFAWITHRWGVVWPAIGLHAAINLWWDLSWGTMEYASWSRTSFAPLPVAHAVTVAVALLLTLRATRQVRQVQPVQQVRLV
jgi:membrane protease YdiL (CAAX protease family)